MNIIKLEYLKKILLPAFVTDDKPGALLNINISKIVELINNTLPSPINFSENNRFILNDLNSIMGRGHHSNNNISEIFICLSGSCVLELFDGLEKYTFTIKKNECIYIPDNIWLDFYNFNNANILVLTSKIASELENEFFIKSSVYNMEEYLTKNNIPPEKKSIYLQDFLLIEHVIPIFWNDTGRFLLTKKVFSYYKDLRQIFFYSHKIILNFTIIGSNGNESLKLFNDNLVINDGVFNDTYIEFDQSKYDTKIYSVMLKLLSDKWRKGFEISMKNQSDITVMRGSNDIVDPFIYIQIKEQYNPLVKKIYMASKTIPELDVLNFSIINICKNTPDGNILINDIDNVKYVFNNQYPHNYAGKDIFEKSISTIAFLGFSSSIMDKILKLSYNICLANECELEMTIRRNITKYITLTQDTFFINPKVINKIDNVTQESNLKSLNNLHISKVNNKIMNRAKKLINYFNNKDITILENIIQGYRNRGISKELLSTYKEEINGDRVYYKKKIGKKILKNKELLLKHNPFRNVKFSIPSTC